MFRALQERVEKLDSRTLTLPQRTVVDQKIIDQMAKTFQKIVGKEPAQIEDEAPNQ